MSSIKTQATGCTTRKLGSQGLNAMKFDRYRFDASRLKTARPRHGSLISALLTCITFGLQGCAQLPLSATQGVAPPMSEPEAVSEKTVTEDKPFATDTLYSLLVAEMAIDRKRYDIALGNYVQQATTTQDANVAARATHIARVLKARQPALEMSQLWLALDPSNTDARLIAATELVEANRLSDALAISKALLESGDGTIFGTIARTAENSDIRVVKALIEDFRALLNDHPEHVSLWIGQSRLMLQAGELEAALGAANKAKGLDNNSIRSVLQETRVLHKMGKVELANQRLSKLVEQNPNNLGLRARYARLVWSTSPREALQQFSFLHEQAPGDPEILYSLALIEKDLGEFVAAQAHFELLIYSDQYTSAAHFHLGSLLEKLHNKEQALEHYLQVEAGKDYISAMVKATEILIENNQGSEAVALVRGQKAHQSGSLLENLYLLEADLFSQMGQMKASETSMNEGIALFPDSSRLYYARAMLYTQIDYISAAETDLKYVLELAPENAAALNALGYTLADRTDRYQEAHRFIEKAFTLTPNDPAVLDSMGWVSYRLGENEKALSFLKQAMAAMPDPEIAAHLGEVLWITGNRQEAIAIWKKGLELKPKSKVIHQTLHRLEAKLD
ncbi:MAG: tetratricopeptide (TPR) repeat protein [Lentisphaeria bacterium]|jgi:tetratricopeptide (TPR) repeat protein